MTPDPLEALLATVLDAEPIMEDPELDPRLMSSFTTDVAEDMHPPEDIAKRYGFRDGHHMIEYITANRGVRKTIKAKRAVFTSNPSIEVVNRKKANFVISEAMADMAAPLFDPKVPPAVRLDTLKVFSRMAGIDGVPAGAAAAAAGPAGAGFTVNFHFSGQPTQSITTVVDVQADKPAENRLVMPELGPPPPHIPLEFAEKRSAETSADEAPEESEISLNRPGLAGIALRDFYTQGVGKVVG